MGVIVKNGLKHHLSLWGVRLLDQLLPPRCLSCGAGAQDSGRICPDCWKELDFLQGPMCRCCGHPFGFDMAQSLCASCQKSLPPFDRARAALRYDDGSRRMIISFKHGDRADYGDFFVQLLMQASQNLPSSLPSSLAFVVPVPLHKKRLRQRRYNQAALIARKFAAQKGFDYVADMLIRHRYTPPQEGNYGQRQRNVAGAFAFSEKYREKIQDRRIIVIDDVYTTGATASACARILKKAGAGSVEILTLARVCAVT